MRVVLNPVPMERDAVVLLASWLYVAYRSHVAARHRGRILHPRQAERVFRATLRSLMARSAPSRAVSFRAPLLGPGGEVLEHLLGCVAVALRPLGERPP